MRYLAGAGRELALHMKPFLLIPPACIALVCSTGCKKEHLVQGPAVSTHIAVQVDSAFIQAPNLVTPNYDGINDIFTVVAANVVQMNTVVRRLNGDTAFHSTSLLPVWDELDSTDLGKYSVTIHAVSTSGHHLSGQGTLDVLLYGGEPCLNYAGTPVTGDQFNPRQFGAIWPSADIFCE